MADNEEQDLHLEWCYCVRCYRDCWTVHRQLEVLAAEGGQTPTVEPREMPLYILACGHTLCQQCLKINDGNQAVLSAQCTVCSHTSSAARIALDRMDEVPPEVQPSLRSTGQLLQEVLGIHSYQHGKLVKLVRFLKYKVLTQRNQISQFKAQMVDAQELQSRCEELARENQHLREELHSRHQANSRSIAHSVTSNTSNDRPHTANRISIPSPSISGRAPALKRSATSLFVPAKQQNTGLRQPFFNHQNENSAFTKYQQPWSGSVASPSASPMIRSPSVDKRSRNYQNWVQNQPQNTQRPLSRQASQFNANPYSSSSHRPSSARMGHVKLYQNGSQSQRRPSTVRGYN